MRSNSTHRNVAQQPLTRLGARLKLNHAARRVLMITALALAASQPSIASAVSGLPGLEAALEVQRQRSLEQPDDAGALNDLGNLLVLSGRITEAEETYRKALGMSQGDPAIRLNLGLLLQQIGEDKEAIKEFKIITDSEPDNPWPYYQMGLSWESRGEARKAVRNYVKAFSLDRRLTDPVYNPQVIQSTLSTQSLVTTYMQDSAGSLAPRSYAQPSLIRTLIVPQLAAPSHQKEETEASESMVEPSVEPAVEPMVEPATPKTEAPAVETRPTRRKPRSGQPAVFPNENRKGTEATPENDLADALRRAAESNRKKAEKKDDDPDG